MIPFQGNIWTNGWTEGQTDPISWDPSSYCQRSKITTADESHRYRVRSWSNHKLLYHSQHAKNQLNSYAHF